MVSCDQVFRIRLKPVTLWYAKIVPYDANAMLYHFLFIRILQYFVLVQAILEVTPEFLRVEVIFNGKLYSFGSEILHIDVVVLQKAGHIARIARIAPVLERIVFS